MGRASLSTIFTISIVPFGLPTCYIDDKRMEGWVPGSRISTLNKKNLKRLRDVDSPFVEKVMLAE